MSIRSWFGRKKTASHHHRCLLRTEQLEDRMLLHAEAIGSNMLINDLAIRKSLEFSAADVSLTDGGGAVVYQGLDVVGGRSNGNGREIFGQRLDADGAPVDDLFRVNSVTRGSQAHPAVAADEDGEFTVVWDGRGAGDLQGIFAQRYAADGTSLGTQLRINSDAMGFQYHPQIAMNATGVSVVVWHGNGPGDVDGVFARRIDAAGTPFGSDILVNTTTLGEQTLASVGVDADGNFVVAWNNRGPDDSDWDVFFQRFDTDGNRLGAETQANSEAAGSQFGATVQRTADGDFLIAWSSFGQDGDGWGVFAQQFDAQGVAIGSEFQVNSASAGHQLDVSVALADTGDFVASWSHAEPNGLGWEVHGQVFHADGDDSGGEFTVNDVADEDNLGHQRSPAAAINNTGMSVVAFQGQTSSGRLPGVASQRYEIDVAPAQNVAPALTDIADQTIRVSDFLSADVTATDRNRNDVLSFSLDPNQSPPGATITQISDRMARVTWQPSPADRGRNVPFRVLVDDDGDPMMGDAGQFIVTVENSPPILDVNGPSETGLDSTAFLAEGETGVLLTDDRLTLTDGDQVTQESATATINTILDGASESLSVDTAGTDIVQTYNSATGVLMLTGTETVANYQRVLRTLRYENTASAPTPGPRRVEVSVFDDTDRSEAANIVLTIEGPNVDPTLADLSTVTLLAGSPLHIPLDGADDNGDDLRFTVTSSDPSLVSARVLTGNRSLRMVVEDFGEMIFELFEGRAPRATSQITALAEEGFYDATVFHRVINGFVIQGGDPTVTGGSASMRPDFDDQFDFELQHNRTGVLSMAKSTDDTNNSQFFVTEGAQRSLDFNHTIFGQLTEGDSVREAISNVPVDGFSPDPEVFVETMEVFTDTENGVLVLSAAEGATGMATITVEVSDGRGGTFLRQFTVNVQPDTINGGPFLADIPEVRIDSGRSITIQLQARDVEDDPVFFLDEDALSSQGLFVPVASHPELDYSVDPTTGLVTLLANQGLMGTFTITVATAASLSLDADSHIDYQVVSVRVNTPLDPT